jgi:hypothetical protein
LRTCCFAGYIFRNDADAFMAHTLLLHLNRSRCAGARAVFEIQAPAAAK